MDTDCIYLLTFDFSNLKISDIEYWLKFIKSTLSLKQGTIVVLGVGTNSEKLSDEEIVNTIETLKAKFPKRVFPFLMDILPISCKTTNGLNGLKKKLKELTKNPSFPLEVPPTWVQLNMKIKSVRATGREYVLWDEYSKWSEGVGIFDPEELEKATSFLNSIGSLTNFKKRFDQNIIFLDPNCLVTLMDNIMDIGSELNPSGIIKKSHFSMFCKNFPKALYNEILKLLLHMKIFIYLPNQDGNYFSMTSLAKNAPRTEITKLFPSKLNESDACFGRVFKFQQLPLTLLDRVLASILNLPNTKHEILWKSGILVKKIGATTSDPTSGDDVYAFIEYFHESYKLCIELRFNRTDKVSERIALAFWRQLLELVRTNIDGFCSGVSWAEYIPCIHCIRRGVFRDQVYLFEYQDVINSLDNPFMYCNNIESSSRCIPRMEVAPDISLRDLPQVSQRRLQIGKQIGEGGFGVVYQGQLEDNIVAVKELSGELDGELFREFQIEAFIQSLLDHPNCVKLYGLTANPPRMILEFISGGDLCHLIHPKDKSKTPTLQTLPWIKRYQISFDIIKGLYHMQKQNPPIIHRDLRSPNIFMTSDGRALIGDFGLARQVNPEIGGMLGTWQWLAPECIDSIELNSYDERTDIYSFGMVLWEIVTCNVPFEEYENHPKFSIQGKLKLQDLKRAIIDDHLRPSIPSDIPSEISNLIQQCWNHDIDKRPTCESILLLLGKLCNKIQESHNEINNQSKKPLISMDSRLSSHLVTFHAPEVQKEKPISSLKLDKSEGKPRIMINTMDSNIWIGTTTGFIHICTYQEDKIQKKYKWQAHSGRIANLIYDCNTCRVWSCSDDDGTIRIWDVKKRSIDNSISPFGKVNRGFGPSNLLIVNQHVWVSSPQQGQIAICSLETAELISTIENRDLIGMNGMALHKDYIWVANSGSIFMYDCNSFECIGCFQAHHSGRMAMIIESVGDTVWTVCSTVLRIWDAPRQIESMSLAKETSISDSKFLSIKYSPDTSRIFTGAFNGEVVMWNSRSGEAMQEMVPTQHAINDLVIDGDFLWCVTGSCEVFLFNSNNLHPKPKPMKIDMKTLRNFSPSSASDLYQKQKQQQHPSQPSSQSPSERRSKLNSSRNSIASSRDQASQQSSSSNTSAYGRKKQKGITLRKEVDDSDITEEEVAKKLATPLLTLRKSAGSSANTTTVPNSQTLIRVLASTGQVLPCNVFADSSTTVANLFQKLIPLALKQLNIYQPGLPYELMWYKNTQACRFGSSDLTQPLLNYGNTFVLNRIPTENMAAILAHHKIALYSILNDTPEPTAQIQISYC